MKILHVSDIHYRESSDTWALLKEATRQFERLRPDYILITGDLTYDGLDEQFERVKRFISSLDFCETLIIPGNRDAVHSFVPVAIERSDLACSLLMLSEPAKLLDEIQTLENVNRGRQTKFFEHFEASEYFYRANGIAAVGLNSTPEITSRQMDMAVQHFSKGQPGELRIFCAHHSFLPVPTKKLKPGDTVPRAADILQALIELNVDLLCCGHIHRSHVWDLSDGRHRLLCCNAGSLLDTSGKKDNGYLEIDIGHDLNITKHTLFSRYTERLYHRSRFGDMLKARQESRPNDTFDYKVVAPNDVKSDGRVKKKAKGKK